MKYFLLILFTSFLFTASAQFIFIPKKPVVKFSGIIDKYESCQLKDSIPFSYIRIIDSRYDTTGIGFYIDGYLALKDSTQEIALQHTLDKYYHTLYATGKDTLVIQLEKLSIIDKLVNDTNLILTCGSISCKLFTGGNKRYVYLGSFDTLMKEKFSFSSFREHKNGKHSNYEFWDYYLLRLCEAMITNASQFNNIIDSNQQQYAIENIKQEGLLKRQKPILTDTILKPGFYNNFTEFENNSPGFTYDSANALPKLLELMHYRVSKKISNEAPDTSYWGFCDGKHLFIRNGYNFFELERKDACFYIAPILDGRRRDLNAAGWNLLTGIAMLSAGIATKEGVDFHGFSTIQEPDVPTILLKFDEGYVLGLQVDLDTGNITW